MESERADVCLIRTWRAVCVCVCVYVRVCVCHLALAIPPEILYCTIPVITRHKASINIGILLTWNHVQCEKIFCGASCGYQRQ